jgi:DNA repair protein RadC
VGQEKQKQPRTIQDTTRIGHRKRLRERLRRGGYTALHDYELLELILFRALPRRDVKPLARDLLDRFGDLSGVLSATDARLLEVTGIGQEVITEFRLIEAVALNFGQSRIMHKPALANWNQMISYCRTKIAEKNKEEFHVLFLDKKNHIIADEMKGSGTVDHAPVYPREVIKRALELSASALILVHNHPSGDPTPSKADIDMTNKLYALASQFNIVVHDHLIIGRVDEVSLKIWVFWNRRRRIFSPVCFAQCRQSAKASAKEIADDSALCPSRNDNLMGSRKPLFNLA